MKFIYITIILSLYSCLSPNLHYVGRTYPETKKIDVYLESDKIDKKYTIMGYIIAETADELVSSEKMQESIVKKAKEKGADAIILSDLEFLHGGRVYHKDRYDSREIRIETKKKLKKKEKPRDDKKKKEKKKRIIEDKHSKTRERVYNERIMRLEADFIKYE